MKIVATKVKAKDLKPGDLFSAAGQSHWDSAVGPNTTSVGEKVWIRTHVPCMRSQEDDEVYRIKIERGDEE